MTTQQFLKGLMMALIAVIVAGFSTQPIDYIMMAVAAVSTIFVYVGKNLVAVLHSDSPAGSLSFINIISGVIIAVGVGVLDGVTLYIINGVVEWAALLKLVLAVTFTYLGGTVLAPPYTTVKKKFFV